MIAAARTHDVNLFSFPGGSVQPVGEFDPQRSTIYNLVGVNRFDGLVTSGATAPGGLDSEHASAFLRRYQPLPIVSLTRLSDEMPDVTMDSYQGMQAVLLHLIQTHGLRHLAFVRGPEKHYHAQERYRAYVETLQELGFPVDLHLVTPPLHWEAGEEAVHILLDEHPLSVQGWGRPWFCPFFVPGWFCPPSVLLSPPPKQYTKFAATTAST